MHRPDSVSQQTCSRGAKFSEVSNLTQPQILKYEICREIIFVVLALNMKEIAFGDLRVTPNAIYHQLHVVS